MCFVFGVSCLECNAPFRMSHQVVRSINTKNQIPNTLVEGRFSPFTEPLTICQHLNVNSFWTGGSDES